MGKGEETNAGETPEDEPEPEPKPEPPAPLAPPAPEWLQELAARRPKWLWWALLGLLTLLLLAGLAEQILGAVSWSASTNATLLNVLGVPLVVLAAGFLVSAWIASPNTTKRRNRFVAGLGSLALAVLAPVAASLIDEEIKHLRHPTEQEAAEREPAEREPASHESKGCLSLGAQMVQLVTDGSQELARLAVEEDRRTEDCKALVTAIKKLHPEQAPLTTFVPGKVDCVVFLAQLDELADDERQVAREAIRRDSAQASECHANLAALARR